MENKYKEIDKSDDGRKDDFEDRKDESSQDSSNIVIDINDFLSYTETDKAKYLNMLLTAIKCGFSASNIPQTLISAILDQVFTKNEEIITISLLIFNEVCQLVQKELENIVDPHLFNVIFIIIQECPYGFAVDIALQCLISITSMNLIFINYLCPDIQSLYNLLLQCFEYMSDKFVNSQVKYEIGRKSLCVITNIMKIEVMNEDIFDHIIGICDEYLNFSELALSILSFINEFCSRYINESKKITENEQFIAKIFNLRFLDDKDIRISQAKFAILIIEQNSLHSFPIIMSQFFEICVFDESWDDISIITIFHSLKKVIHAFRLYNHNETEAIKQITDRIAQLWTSSISNIFNIIEDASFNIKTAAAGLICEILLLNHGATVYTFSQNENLINLLMDVLNDGNPELVESVLKSIRKILASSDEERDLTNLRIVLSADFVNKMDELVDDYSDNAKILELANLLREDIDQYLEFLEIDGITV